MRIDVRHNRALAFLARVWRAFNQDKATRLAAAIAYSAIFSLAPLLVVLIAIAGSVLGAQNGGHGHHLAEDALLDQIRRRAGPASANMVRDLVAVSFNKPRQGAIAQPAGWVAFALGAASLFSTLQDAFNSVWSIEFVSGGWKQMLRDRLAAFGMVAIVALLLLASFAAGVALTFVDSHAVPRLPAVFHTFGLPAATFAVTFGLLTVVFGLLYKVLPDVDIEWRDVWLGAVVTAALFVVGQAVVSLYLARAGVASAYGAAGSLLVTLLWIYYSALILLLGAEFTKVVARSARTSVDATIRRTSSEPAGIDPRAAGQ